jgi:hypothetical protein
MSLSRFGGTTTGGNVLGVKLKWRNRTPETAVTSQP